MDDNDYQRLRDYALKLLSFRPRSRKEMEDKLFLYAKKKKILETAVVSVVDGLIDVSLINDKEFASWWREERLKRNPKGKKIVRFELLQKGVSREIIDSIFGEKKTEDEYDAAKQFIQRKVRRVGALPEKDLKLFVSRLLLRRGFDWDVINRVIDSLGEKA